MQALQRLQRRRITLAATKVGQGAITSDKIITARQRFR